MRAVIRPKRVFRRVCILFRNEFDYRFACNHVTGIDRRFRKHNVVRHDKARWLCEVGFIAVYRQGERVAVDGWP